jgi:uncharacterized membrane protein
MRASAAHRGPLEVVRRAFSEFLLLPSLIVGGFLLLAIATDLLDHASWGWVQHAHDAVGDYVFGKPEGTSSVLGAIAGGVITMTSIIVTVLLVALQQSSTNLTPQVFDQFLRRRQNQLFFGYFVGLAVYTLIVLASIDSPFTPVFGAIVALLATVVALLMMITMLYSTITQMRPVVIVSAIHDHILHARRVQRALVERTRRTSLLPQRPVEITADIGGFVTELQLAELAGIATRCRGEVELTVSIGGFVATGDVIALWRGDRVDDEIRQRIRAAVYIERRRDITRDPAYGIEQLQTIGWSAISSAKHNQEAGLLCIRLLRDVMGCWVNSGDLDEVPQAADHHDIAVVYHDNVATNLFEAFELLGMVTGESLQQQCLAAVLDSISVVYGRLHAGPRRWVDEVIVHLLAPLREQAPTHTLQGAVDRLEDALRRFDGSPLAALEHTRREAPSRQSNRR